MLQIAKLLGAAALVGALLVCVSPPSARAGRLAPLSACPGQTATASRDAEVAAMRCLVDWARRWEGIHRLRSSPRLDRAAGLRAAEIARCRHFSHTPCSHAFTSEFAQAGYMTAGASVGENLAFGSAELGSPRSIMAGWLASPHHRANLLRRRWRDLGVAVLHANLFGATNVSLWVADFGRKS